MLFFLGVVFFGVYAPWGLHGNRDSLFVGAFAPESGDDHTSFRTARPSVNSFGFLMCSSLE